MAARSGTVTRREPGRFGRIVPWLSLLVRLGLVVVWLWASFPKLTNSTAAAVEVQNYHIFPSGLATQLGHVQPFVELTLGLLLLAGFGTRITALLSGVLFLAFIGGITSLWVRGIYINCGCFSTSNTLYVNAWAAHYPEELARDTGFVLMAAWLAIWPKTPFSADAWLLPAPAES
jgi:uncharacterized membrane protein YphA (DoxX/SURF4 family)